MQRIFSSRGIPSSLGRFNAGHSSIRPCREAVRIVDFVVDPRPRQGLALRLHPFDVL